MPDDLRERIRSHAKKNSRSINGEIVAALEVAYPLAADLSVNAKLLDATKAIITSWESVLAAIGQDPSSNAALNSAKEAVSVAEDIE